MEEVIQILKELDWSPLVISLKTGVVATIISFFLGIFAARKVVKASPGKKAVVENFSSTNSGSKWCRPGWDVS